MKLEELDKFCYTLAETALAEGKSLRPTDQFKVEYAMQAVGRISAQVNQVHLWLLAIDKWHKTKLMTDPPPDLCDFVARRS